MYESHSRGSPRHGFRLQGSFKFRVLPLSFRGGGNDVAGVSTLEEERRLGTARALCREKRELLQGPRQRAHTQKKSKYKSLFPYVRFQQHQIELKKTSYELYSSFSVLNVTRYRYLQRVKCSLFSVEEVGLVGGTKMEGNKPAGLLYHNFI